MNEGPDVWAGPIFDGPMQGQEFAAREPEFKIIQRTLITVGDWRAAETSARHSTTEYRWDADKKGWTCKK